MKISRLLASGVSRTFQVFLAIIQFSHLQIAAHNEMVCNFVPNFDWAMTMRGRIFYEETCWNIQRRCIYRLREIDAYCTDIVHLFTISVGYTARDWALFLTMVEGYGGAGDLETVHFVQSVNSRHRECFRNTIGSFTLTQYNFGCISTTFEIRLLQLATIKK